MKRRRAYFTPSQWAVLGVLTSLVCVLVIGGGLLVHRHCEMDG